MKNLLKSLGYDLNGDWRLLTISEGSIDIDTLKHLCNELDIEYRCTELRSKNGVYFEVLEVKANDLDYLELIKISIERKLSI